MITAVQREGIASDIPDNKSVCIVLCMRDSRQDMKRYYIYRERGQLMAQRSRREQTRDKDRQEFSPTTASLTLKSTGVGGGSLKKI